MGKGLFCFIALITLVPVWTALVQALMLRLGLRKMRSRQMTVVVSSAALALPLGALLWFTYLKGLDGTELIAAIIYAVMVYCLLAYLYFHLFNMSETARRIRIVTEIRLGGKISVFELKRLYDTGQMLDVRLGRLESIGQIREEGGRYYLKSKALYAVALAVSWWAGLLGFTPLKGFHK